MQRLCLLQLQGPIQNFPKGGVEIHDTKSRVCVCVWGGGGGCHRADYCEPPVPCAMKTGLLELSARVSSSPPQDFYIIVRIIMHVDNSSSVDISYAEHAFVLNASCLIVQTVNDIWHQLDGWEK